MRAFLVLGIFVGVNAIAGCSWSAVATCGTDPELARETLLAALDAWKSGQTQSLGKRTPPIRFTDDDYLSGAQLTEYDLQLPDVLIAPFRNVPVELVLRDARGQTIRKIAMYQVGVEPGLTVLRSDN